MKRFTFLLTDDLANLLDQERRRRGVSAATIVREAVAAYIKVPNLPNLPNVPNVPTEPRHLPFAALGHSGLTDLAKNDERYLDDEWGSDEFFERTMGRYRDTQVTPEEQAAETSRDRGVGADDMREADVVASEN